MADLGTGTIVAFTGTGITSKMRSVEQGEVSVAVIDMSHLLTTGAREKLAGDLVDHDSLTIEAEIDQAKISELTGAIGVTDTIKITFPLATLTTAGFVTGTGFVSTFNWSTPIDDAMVTSFTWTWDGGTGPTYTDEV